MMELFSALMHIMFRDEEGGGLRCLRERRGLYCSWRRKIPTFNQISEQRCSGLLASLSVIHPFGRRWRKKCSRLAPE